MKETHVPVFRSPDPDSFARAVTLLKAAGVRHKVVDQQEGGSKFPRRVHFILVPSSQADTARQILSVVPSEVILPEHPSQVTPADRTLAWLQLTPLIIIILYAIIKNLTK